jgi:hypothetical protein
MFPAFEAVMDVRTQTIEEPREAMTDTLSPTFFHVTFSSIRL